jgi:hypothetical protein
MRTPNNQSDAGMHHGKEGVLRRPCAAARRPYLYSAKSTPVPKLHVGVVASLLLLMLRFFQLLPDFGFFVANIT